MARQDPAHWLVVDATQPQEVIHRIVLDRLEAL
ncbi:MAG: dTMP kinase, partial [Chloroflexi bacterium]|nr:dTMP kinase [Chloroflexota bacterium]